MNTLTPLQERRLAELKQVVAAQAADDAPGRRTSRRTSRRVLRPALALATAAAGATGVAVGLVATTGGGTPAFAVTKSASGIVTIKITDYRDTSQLTAELQGLGVPAAVVFVPAGEYCYQPKADVVRSPAKGLDTVPAAIPGGLEMTFNTSMFRPGESVIFGLGDVVSHGARAESTSTFVVTGQLTACQFRPEPPFVLPPALRHLKGKGVSVAGADIKFPNDNYSWPSGN